jgi:hypothetical protein
LLAPDHANTSSGWHTPVPDTHAAARLLSARAVREHCEEIFACVTKGKSPHFSWHAERLPATAAYVAEVIRERYADLKVPYHSRWRHFEAGGVDRWARLAADHGLLKNDRERVKARIDLVIPSVLLDAGAGAAWRYHDGITGQTLTRSEGLGAASLALFAGGTLSDDSAKPLRSDAAALSRIRQEDIASAFQVSAENPLVGLAGRAALLTRLGAVAAATPAVFGTPARLGNLFDYLNAHAPNGKIEAGFILATLLRALGPMWPGRMTLDGVSLGDCWPHPAATGGRVPFHKLTQWLTYSLLEPLQEAGLIITDVDALTGLPEYRNGGLLLDMGVIESRDATFHTRILTVDDPMVVEWRAITVAVLDRLANSVRELLHVSAEQFPLACVLEGGTWAAGRKIAAVRRAGGAPPINIVSDGTVF